VSSTGTPWSSDAGRLLDEWSMRLPASLSEAMTTAEAQGRTVVAVGWDGTARGLLVVADAVKETSAEAVAQLRDLGLTPVLLTGDNETVARSVAGQVGIDQVIAGVLPQEKVGVVRRLQAEGRSVAMVGDGINDAAALAQADLGLAMGTGTDVAMEASDLTLVRGDLRAAADAIRLARRTLGTIRGNLFWAFAYNVAALPLAAAGLLNPMLAGAAMALSSVFVVTNSLRLRGFRSSPAVHADGVATAVPRLPVPRRPPLVEHQTGIGAPAVVRGQVDRCLFEGQVRGVQPETCDQQATRCEVRGEPTQDLRLRPGREQRDHVAGRQHQVEDASEVQARQVLAMPLQRRSPLAGDGEHRRADVHADALVATRRQLDRHPTGPAPGVEDAACGATRCVTRSASPCRSAPAAAARSNRSAYRRPSSSPATSVQRVTRFPGPCHRVAQSLVELSAVMAGHRALHDLDAARLVGQRVAKRGRVADPPVGDGRAPSRAPTGPYRSGWRRPARRSGRDQAPPAPVRRRSSPRRR
jgi:soluble P-type ATPase